MTKRTASFCMAILWIVPNAALFAYFSSIENQGFQVKQKKKNKKKKGGKSLIKKKAMIKTRSIKKSQRCKTDFIRELRFRGQYASFFFAPLIFMIFIYGHIFIIIRRHQANRRALIQHGSRHATPISSTAAGHSTTVTVETAGSASLRYHSHHQSSVSSARRFPIVGNKTSLHRQRNPAANCSVSTNSDSTDHSNNAVNRNVKVTRFKLLRNNHILTKPF